MMDRSAFLYRAFSSHFKNEPTPCQDRLFHSFATFASGDDADILVVNGYAGTGKTTALSAVIETFAEIGIQSVLLAPTGRAAKVLSAVSGRQASTIHKHIYRQKSVSEDGFGRFSICPNKSRNTLFVVDEVSLIGVDSSDQKNTAFFGTGNLLEDLVSFVRSGVDCRLVMVGDSAQLPPVGLDASPALSREFMDGFGGVMYEELHTVVRQAEGSPILRNATMLRELISSSDGCGAFDSLRLDISAGEGGECAVERIGGGELIETLTDAYGEYGEDETVILCRSNKRAVRYNLGIRNTVQFKEESLVRGDKLMIVKNCYKFVDEIKELDYIANGDMAELVRVRHFEQRYGLHFADAVLSFPDYGNVEIDAKVCLDTLDSDSASLSFDQQNALFQGVWEDYAHMGTKKKIYDSVREDMYYNALQLKYAEAITCHKSQGGQWRCVFIDCPFWQDEQSVEDLKWLYTALTRAVEKVYLVNFNDRFFI